MRRIFHPLSFMVFSSVISVSAQALSSRDETFALGFAAETSSYNKACDGYPPQSRKNTICRSYPEDQVVAVQQLPAAKKLKSNTLYLVKNDSEIEAPYALKPGVGILPSPDKTSNLTLTLSGSGTDHDCALCVMKFAEGTKVAGLTVNLSSSSWKPNPGESTEKAIFYGATTESEFSESIVLGRSDFIDVVHQLQTVSDGKMQSYHRLKLYAEGSQHLLRVENTSSSAAKAPDRNRRHVDIVDSIGILSGGIPSDATEQGGFVITNLVGAILSSSIFYDPLDPSQTFPRYGVIATDTPALYLYRDSHKVTQKNYRREQDIEEIYRNKLQSSMQVFSDDNSYFAQGDHYINELSDPSQLVYYLGNNEEYVSTDVDASPDNIDKLTRNGGFFLGNAMQLEAICPLHPNDYNASNPLPAVNGLQISAGPVNATVRNFYEYCTESTQSSACDRSIKDRLIDGSIGFGFATVIVSIPWLIGTICLCAKARKKSGYININDNDNI